MRLIKKRTELKPFAYIPMGEYSFEVLGTRETQYQLWTARTNNWFTLTPLSDDQKKGLWSEMAYLRVAPGGINVNLYQNTETTQAGWLGYIHPEWRRLNPALYSMVDDLVVSVGGRISIDADGIYHLVLFLPLQYQIKIHVNLSQNSLCKNNIDRILQEGIPYPTGKLVLETIQKDTVQQRYRAEANGLVIGYTKPDVVPEINNYYSPGMLSNEIPASFILRKRKTGGWSEANIRYSGTLPLSLQD